MSGARSDRTFLHSDGPLLDRVGKKTAGATTDPGRLEAKDGSGFPEKKVLHESAVNSGIGGSAVNLLNLFRKLI